MTSGCIELGTPAQAKSIPEVMTFMISSNTVSNFTPCGCASGKWGGMPRRGTIYTNVINEISWPFIPVDTGDVSQGSTTEIQQTKDDYVFQAYQVVGIDTVNVGLNELRLGVDALQRYGNLYGIHWISCNIYPSGAFPDLPMPRIDSDLPTNPSPMSQPDGEPIAMEPMDTSPTLLTNESGSDSESDLEETSEQEVPEADGSAAIAPDSVFDPYIIVEPDGYPDYKIGFLGAMIQEAGRLNPLRADFSFEPYQIAIPRNVNILRNVEKVDLIVLVCDTEIFPQDFQNTDVLDGIDILIGGNTQPPRSPNATFNPLNTTQFNEMQALQYMRDSGQLPSSESQETDPGTETDTSESESEDPIDNIVLEPLDLPVMISKGQNRGRLVRRMDVFLNGAGKIVDYYTTEIRADEFTPDDPRLDEIARGYDREVHAVEVNGRVTRRFIGSQACEECHPGYQEAWADFGHLHSYESVQNSETPMDRECTRCHAVGYVDESRLLTYDLIPDSVRNVGCEGCHMNGYQHITLQNHIAQLSPENRGSVTTTDTMATDISITMCQKCHTGFHDWSPPFDFQSAMNMAREICPSVE